MKKKLSLPDLSIQSFVTTLDATENIKGGSLTPLTVFTHCQPVCNSSPLDCDTWV